jgi:PAS domain S-box-containing protein
MKPERDTADLFENAGAGRGEMEADDEHELALFFNQSHDLLCIAGFDGYFKLLNPAWTIRLGWSLEELAARPLLDFVHPDDLEATRAEVEALARGREANLFENRYRHLNGSYRWLQWNAWPEPKSQLIYATARDVTRRKRLEREILEVADSEKERLGRELHDGLCQTLAGIAALSTTLARRLAKSSETSASAAAGEITQLLSEAIGETRDLAHGLGPLDPRGGDLGAALEALALRVPKQFHVSCTFVGERPPLGLRHDVESHLYRIAQEAVSNAVAHAGGDRIVISLGSKDGFGILSVRDDGRGVPEAATAEDGMGMQTMAYRARRIGGSLEVRRRRPRGTAVTCTFPLPETADTGETPEA